MQRPNRGLLLSAPATYAPVTLQRRWRPYSWSNRWFHARRWTELADHYWRRSESQPDLPAIVEIIESLIASDAQTLLVANWTIGGFNVAYTDEIEPPYTVIAVSVIPASSTAAVVEIRHVSGSGLVETVVRPVDEAVPLLWRFVREKYGIELAHGQPATDGPA